MAQPGHTDDPVADAAEPAEPAQPVEPAVALWGLDPLFSAHAMLLACMVQQLRPSQRVPGVFFLKAHPMQRVHIVGHIVSVSARQKFVQYLVDDGTAVLPCVVWKMEKEADDRSRPELWLKLGQLVSVRGGIKEYRGKRQLNVNSIVPEDDPHVELLHWLEVAHLMRTVYAQPFPASPSGPGVPGAWDKK